MIIHGLYKHFLALFGVQPHVMLGRKLVGVANSVVQEVDTVPWQHFQRSCVVHKFYP